MPEPVPAPPQVSLVSDGAGLAAMLRELAGVACVGADIEGDGLYRYRSRLCVLQLATPERVWLVDTLAIWDPASLGALLGPAGPTKILHDAAFDARLLREYGVVLDNVFDTSVAARFLGERNTGLGSLLAARCRLTVAKGLQKADWGRRPLDEQALVYLADDVRHLFALEASLRADVERLGIDEAVETETRHMLARAQLEPVTAPTWLRVKGVRELAAEAQGVVRALVELRDSLARSRDVPPFRVFSDALILELAAARPASMEALSRLRGLRSQAGNTPPRALFDAVQQGLRQPPSAEDLATEPPPGREQRALERTREKALGAWRRTQAELRGVDPQVVLPGHCLSDLAARGATCSDELEAIAGFGHFRVVKDGDALLSVVREAETAGGGAAAP